MKSCSSMRRSVSNNRGSAFVQALVAVGVVGVMIYFLSPTVIKHRSQVAKTASIITARLALHSMVDYTLFGIRQRWCFSEAWMQESCGSSTPPKAVEILSHPRSVERLLMKQETVDFLRVIGIANPEKVPLVNGIVQEINIANFSTMHPVYKIVADLKGYTVEFIRIEITRDVRAAIPEYGREVYLKVVVSLLDRQKKIIEVGSSRLVTTSFVGVYPREVGSFALLVAGDLRLDKESASDLGVGGAYFKQHGSRQQMLKYPGLTFDSPVFVNGSIHLPKAPDLAVDLADGDTVYTPVTFKDKVILGFGPIKRENAEFKPRSAGNESDQFWSNVRQFGGFQKGVEVDGERDLGLDYLSGYATATGNPSANLMAMCKRHEDRKYNLNTTSNSQLTGALLSKSGGKYNYRLAFTDGNLFNPQTKEVERPSVSNFFSSDLLKNWGLTSRATPVSKFKMRFGNLEVEGEVPLDGTVTLEPKIDLRPLERSIERQLSAAEANLDDARRELNRAVRDVERARRDVSDAEDDLERARNRTPADPDRVASARNALGRAQANLREAEGNKNRMEQQVANAEQKVSNLRDNLREVRAKMGIQPKISVTMKNPVKSGDNPENTNASFKDLEIKFENGHVLVNSNGERIPVSFEFEAFDVAYYKGSSMRPWSNNNRGGLVFRPDGGGFDVSQNLLDSRGQSKGNLPEGEDPFVNLDLACKTLGTNTSAFGGTDWSKSFAPNAKHSWSFTNKYEDRKDLILDAGNAYAPPGGTGTAVFHVVSIARTCIIESTANLVAGFLTCEKLVIRSRSTPLRIIGSIIVFEGIEVDEEAYKHGIRWSTIYHPMATFELRQSGILKGLNSQNCTTINRYPVWHPYPSMRDVANLYRCNSLSLRAKADPFRWTSIDPDCGLVNNSNSTMCKNRLMRFYVLEVSRESGI